MKPWFGLVVLLSGGPVLAQDFVDYPALFRDHAARVVRTADGTETLELPPGITISRKDGNVIAMDHSGEGALLCTLSILGELRSVARQCPGIGQDHLPGLEQNFMAVLHFAAENAYPPQDVQALVTRYDQAFSDKLTPEQCQEAHDNPDILMMMEPLSNPAVAEKVRTAPRLPVMNPCL